MAFMVWKCWGMNWRGVVWAGEVQWGHIIWPGWWGIGEGVVPLLPSSTSHVPLSWQMHLEGEFPDPIFATATQASPCGSGDPCKMYEMNRKDCLCSITPLQPLVPQSQCERAFGGCFLHPMVNSNRIEVISYFISLVENENHCDFVKLREMMICTNMEDLIEQTCSVHYELYRQYKLEEMGFRDTDQIR